MISTDFGKDLVNVNVKCPECSHIDNYMMHKERVKGKKQITELCGKCEQELEIKKQENERIEKLTEKLIKEFGRIYRDAKFENIDLSKINKRYQTEYKKAKEYFENLSFNYHKHSEDNKIISLIGTNGTGKTYLLACFAWQCIKNKVPYQYHKANVLLRKYKDLKYSNDFQEKREAEYLLENLKSTNILILDECSLIKSTGEDNEVMFEIIDYRHCNYLTTIICGNILNTSESFQDFFHPAIVDRIRAKNNLIFEFFAGSLR